MTQYKMSAKAFRAVVTEIGNEIWRTWQTAPNVFHVHPPGAGTPRHRREFVEMFQFEVPDANSASVVSSSLGIPIVYLTAGQKHVAGRSVTVNQSQLDRQQPSIRDLVSTIE